MLPLDWRDNMYSYEIWLDGNCIHEDSGFDTQEEAQEEAEFYVKETIEDWWNTGVRGEYSLEDFDIYVK